LRTLQHRGSTRLTLAAYAETLLGLQADWRGLRAEETET